MYDVPVSFYQGGEKAARYKRICLLPLANLYFTPVYSTGPSTTVSEDVQYWRLYWAQNMNFVGLMDRNPICSIFMGFNP